MLTEGEREELKRLERSPQSTYGKGRAAVQNRLVAKGFARFGAGVVEGGYETDMACLITDAGKAELASLGKK